MKLIPLSILAISLAVDAAQEYFTYLPQFQSPRPGVFSTENSVYLPPEVHTPVPYFPMKNVDKLQYPYLPPSGTKSPIALPKPFPVMVSSTLLPPLNNDNEDDDDKRGTSPGPFFINRANYTEKVGMKQNPQMRELKPLPRMFNYQHPIDRIDMKIPYQFPGNNEQTPPNAPTPTPTRSVTISAETRNDRGADQTKSGNFPMPQYLHVPGYFISSTTETAVPILRLSNEMDLDGSFSYEALGADQTHYVQHSRMENAGTDKEEQVVEGSYSYVGDNGLTYTVHYIADSNGFRATGDHLPVAPPIPEIIQRAVQYNLAEEAKKPPHFQIWNEEQQNEISESEKNNRFNILSQNLFTGRTPESFSFNFAQSANPQNNLGNAATSQIPIKITNDFQQDQMNAKASATISPQITFLASQGAHVPSGNTPQQNIARMFGAEKATMPQLVNYEAAIKEPDQESSKALWRWQYGMNPEANKKPEKNTISRSFGEDDDVMINFNDMTPEQYTSMIKTHLEPNKKESLTTTTNKYESAEINDANLNKQNIQQNHDPSTIKMTEYTTPAYTPSNQYKSWYSSTPEPRTNEYTTLSQSNMTTSFKTSNTADSRSKLITYRKFVPASQTVTQSYDYQDYYKSTPRQELNPKSFEDETNLKIIPLNYNKEKNTNAWTNMNDIEKRPQVYSTQRPSDISTITNSYKVSDFIVPDSNDFRPLIEPHTDIQHKLTQKEQTTTTISYEEELRDNIFLKNIFNDNKVSSNEANRTTNKIITNHFSKSIKEVFPEKSPKFIQTESKPINEIKEYKTKPIDISEILNFLTAKNQFESSKIKPKSKPMFNNFNQRLETHFIPIQQNEDDEDYEDELEASRKEAQNRHYQEELRGAIKNYKVLQRNAMQFNRDTEHINRNLSPPPMRQSQTSNLPPLGRAGPSMKSYLPPVYA